MVTFDPKHYVVPRGSLGAWHTTNNEDRENNAIELATTQVRDITLYQHGP